MCLPGRYSDRSDCSVQVFATRLMFPPVCGTLKKQDIYGKWIAENLEDI